MSALRVIIAERLGSTLDAASHVFGEHGYAAARTDAIAQRAGVSQALVIRSFGSKEALFIATTERVVNHVADAFRAAIAEADEREKLEPRLGAAYLRLAEDRGALVTLLHLFTLGHEPTIGPIARTSFLRIYKILREEAGLSASRATAFLATGMLVSTLLGPQLHDRDDALAAELLQTTFRENTGKLTDLLPSQAANLTQAP